MSDSRRYDPTDWGRERFLGPDERNFAVDRIYRRIDWSDYDGCWEWHGAHNKKGYGIISIDNRRICTHRLMYWVERGAIPAGMLVLHKCDNPKCCNPAHLFLGTAKENTQDMMKRGRGAPPPTHKGESCTWSKLTTAEVLAIKELHSLGQHTYTALGRKFGVSNVHVKRIIDGESRASG